MGGEFFRSAPKLRLVQLTSAGYDRVDVEAARKAGVPVSNNGGANAIAVAEHTLMLMLAVLKRVVRFHNDVIAGNWRAADSPETRVYELAGRTLGIVGLGNIGKKVARRAAAFDMHGAVLRHRAAHPRPGGRDRHTVRAVHRAACRPPTW